MFRRMLSLVLCLCVLMSSMPTWTVAALAEGEEAVIEVTAAAEEKEPDPTPKPTKEPTPEPTKEPTPEPTKEPTPVPTEEPTPVPTEEPTPVPTEEPTPVPTEEPTPVPTEEATPEPTEEPTPVLTEEPTEEPAAEATEEPAAEVTEEPAAEATEEPAPEATEAPRFVDGYAYVKAGEAIYDSNKLDGVLGAFAQKAVVYVSAREEKTDEDQDILTLRFACDDQVIKGYVRAKNVQPLTEREVEVYLSDAADADDAVRYQELAYLIPTAFDYEEEQTDGLDTTEEPAAEATEEPAAEATEEPAADVTEEPAAEATEEPAAEATEEPAAEATEEPAAEATEEPVAEATETPADETLIAEDAISEPLAESACEHVFSADRHMYNHYTGEVMDNGDGTHTGIGDVILSQRCSICNEWIEETLQFGVSLTEEHSFSEGACVYCGAVNSCEHEHTNQSSYYSVPDKSAIDYDDAYHWGKFNRYDLVYCDDCHQQLSEVMTEINVDQSNPLPHEWSSNGGCTVCGAENPCTHPNAVSNGPWDREISPVVDNGDGTHTGTFISVLGWHCPDCDLWYNEVVSEAEEKTLPHDWDDGECRFCGALNTCDHNWVEEKDIISYTPGSGTDNGDGTHTVTVDLGDSKHCTKCGESVYTWKSQITLTEEAHMYENGVCWVCGVVNNCDHNWIEYKDEYTYTPGSGTDNGNGTHTVTADLVDRKYCTKCEESSDTWKGQVTLTDQAHMFDGDNVCWICGARNDCKHPSSSQTTFENYYVNQVIESTEAYHVIDYDIYKVKYCQKCNTIIGSETFLRTEQITDAHFYGDNGQCDCGAEGEYCYWETHGAQTYDGQVYQDATYTQLPGTIGGKQHQFSATLVKGKFCAECDQLCEITSIETVSRVEAHTAGEDGLCIYCGAQVKGETGEQPEWAAAPYIHTVSQPAENQVMLAWYASASGAASYRVYEVVSGDNKLAATVTTTTATIKSVANGAHTYIVVPVSEDGTLEGDASNSVTFIVQSQAWKKAPVIKSAKQETTVEGGVTLTWTHTSPAESYVIEDTFDGETMEVALTTGLTITLENVEPGKHSYKVIPRQRDGWGTEVDGTPSAAKVLTVAELWNKKPTLSAAKQDTTGAGEGLVLLTWKRATGALTGAYAVLDKFEGETKVVAVVVYDGATVNYVFEGAEPGTHVYSIAPVKLDRNGDVVYEPDTGDGLIPVMGTASATRTVKVVALWNKKATISLAKQLTTAEGVVQLTWKSGSPLTQAWQVYDKVGTVTSPAGDVIYSDEATVVAEIENVAPGTHAFTVKPVELDENGSPVSEGLVSAAKTVKVVEYWKTAPTILTAVQIDGAVSDEIVALAELTWSAGSEFTEGYAIYDKFGKTTEKVGETTNGETSCIVALKDVGTHSFTVKPIKEDENGEFIEGTASKAKTLVVKAATWRDAPTLTAVQKTTDAEGEVLLSWTQIVKADGFKIYEYVGKQNVPVLDENGDELIVEGAMEYTLSDVSSGSHSYFVVPMHYDDETRAWIAGTASAKKTVKIVEQWSLKPTITEAEQEIEEGSIVTLEWTPGSPLTEAFEVFDNGKQILDEYGEGLIVYQPSARLEDVKVGTHKYTVKPVRENEDGTLSYGTVAAAKSVKVVALWNKKPTIKSAVQLADSEGCIEVKWTTTSVLPESFVVLNKRGGVTVEAFTADELDGMEPDENGVYTVVLEGEDDNVAKGSNSITVKPAHYNDVTGEWEYGLVSAAKAVSVKDLWSLKPTGLTAVQIKTSEEAVAAGATELEDGMVLLTWKPGNVPNLAADYAIFDKNVRIDGNAEIRSVDAKGSMFTAVLYNQTAGSHSYTVKPVSYDDELGLASVAKSLTTVDLWKQKPTITSVVQTANDAVTLTWEPGSELTEAYLVVDQMGSVKNETEVYSETGITLTELASGKHTFTVKPMKDGVYGTVSAAVSFTVVDSTWSTAPVMNEITQSEVGKLNLSWTHVVPSDSYIVYELVGAQLVKIGETSGRSYTVENVTTGTHAYAVRPQQYDAENDKMLYGTVSKTESIYAYGTDGSVSGFTVTHSGMTATLRWNRAPLADGYIIRINDLNSEWSMIQEPGNVSACTVDNLPQAGTYSFSICPYYLVDGDWVEGTLSQPVVVEFGEAVELAAEYDLEKGGVVLNWTASTASTVSGYRIYRQAGDEDMEILASGTFASRAYTDTAVEMDVTYTYQVAAYRASGEDTRSNSATVKVELPELHAVTDLSAWYEGAEVKLSWTPIEGPSGSTNTAAAYKIYRIEGDPAEDKTAYALVGTANYDAANPNTVSFVDAVPDSTRTYSYYVVAREVVGDVVLRSKPSADVTVSAVATAQIKTLAFDAQQGGVLLTWDAIDGAENYTIYRSVQGGAAVRLGDPVSGSSYLDEQVEFGKTYAYYLVTGYADGSYGQSAAKTVAIKRLGQVTELTQWHFNVWVDLSWNAVENAKTYSIERSLDGTTFEEIATTSETAYQDKVTAIDQAYVYRVCAVTPLGGTTYVGAYSATVTAEIGPTLKASAAYSLKAGGVVITWEKSAKNDVVCYNIMRDGYSLFAEDDSNMPGPDDTTFTDTTAVPGETYRYDVAVVRENGEDGTCELEAITIPEGLAKVEGLMASYMDERTMLSWTAVEQAELYEIERSCDGEEPVTFTSTLTEAVDIVPDLAKAYAYRVRACVETDAGTTVSGAWSESFPVARKAAPANVQLVTLEDGMHISWDPMDTTDVIGFGIWRKENDGAPEYLQLGDTQAMKAIAAAGEYVDTTVLSLTDYQYGIEVVYPALAEGCETNIMSYVSVVINTPGTFFDYTDNGDGTATITGYNGTSAEKIRNIPQYVDDLAVTAIGYRAFYRNTLLTGALTLPEGLVSIGEQAFALVDITGELNIPSSVKTIGSGAFNWCSGLNSVVFAGSEDVTLGNGVFRGCTELTSVALPDGLTAIPDKLVEGDTKLSTLELPAGVTSIGDWAMHDCAALTGELRIPDGVTHIGPLAFQNTGYTSIKSFAPVPKTELDETGLPASIATIESDYDKDGEESFEAFANAMGITFIGHGETDTGVLYDRAEDGGAVIIGIKDAAGDLVLPAEVDGIAVTKIGANAFKGNTAITSVTIQGSVTEIGDGAFDGCTSLTTAILPNTVETIGVRAFAQCTSLSSMTAQ